MKFVIMLMVFGLLFVSCTDLDGNYKHMQEQQFGDVPDSAIANGNVYDQLNDNLCGMNPHCCDKFSNDEIFYKSLEEKAILNSNKYMCLNLPNVSLVVQCPGEDDYIYYSRERCVVTIEGDK